MKSAMLPFNVDLIDLSSSRTGQMRPVTSLDYFDRSQGGLHPDGLFSTEIFGPVGSPDRMTRFSYIKLNTTLMHPILYRSLIKLRAMYADIIAGRQYAVFNPVTKQFDQTGEDQGDTGYDFFMRYLPELEVAKNTSASRDARVDLINKYRSRGLYDKLLVLPAGLRDLEVESDGRLQVGEINSGYRKMLGASIALGVSNADGPMFDRARLVMQETFNEIYDQIERMLRGKGGFVLGRWGSRRIFNGTRNVITAMDTSTAELGDPHRIKYTDTVIGLYQALKAMLPLTQHSLLTGYITQINRVGVDRMRLVNPQTLKAEEVNVSPADVDLWTSAEGIERVLNRYGEMEYREQPIMLGKHGLMLLYAGPDGVRLFSDIDELPEGKDRKYVSLVTLSKWLYLNCYSWLNNYVGFVTRYPVTGPESCYPSTIYVKTTVEGIRTQWLDQDWQPDASLPPILEFPNFPTSSWQESMVVPTSRLAGLGGD